MKQFIFSFDDRKINKLKNKKNLLGGKGANLAEMGKLGLPVPPGFTITTEVCDIFYANKKKLPTKILSQIKTEIKKIEKKTSKKFGDLKSPLLVSVRSGARISVSSSTPFVSLKLSIISSNRWPSTPITTLLNI